MNIMIFLIFVSLILVLGSVILFAFFLGNNDINVADSLSMMPLLEDEHANKNCSL